MNFGRWNYIYYLDCIKSSYEVEVIRFLVVLAAVTKRAQIPFSLWLPAASRLLKYLFHMNEWTNERMNEWTNERMNEWTNERMNEWMNVAI